MLYNSRCWSTTNSVDVVSRKILSSNSVDD